MHQQHAVCVLASYRLQNIKPSTAWRRHSGQGQGWGEPREAHSVLHAWRRQRRLGPDTPEFFLTARNSVGTFRIAWSFYAAAMGSWTLFSPAQYANSAGRTSLSAEHR